jgi:agmatine deiminase
MIVYHSRLLKQNYSVTYSGIDDALIKIGIPYVEIPHTKDVWCRDYMPVISSSGSLIQFVYWPRYLQARKYKDTITPPTCYSKLDFCPRVKESVIILDGGNIQICGKVGLVTNRVFEDNYWYDPDDLIEKLKDTLELDKLISIPVEPGDETGHTDGVVRLIDEKTVFLNDYKNINDLKKYDSVVKTILKKENIDIIPFPYYPTKNTTFQGMPSAEGVYINYLKINKSILLPIFGNRNDDIAINTLNSTLPDSIVYPIDCKALASQGGGVINCVSWELSDY